MSGVILSPKVRKVDSPTSDKKFFPLRVLLSGPRSKEAHRLKDNAFDDNGGEEDSGHVSSSPLADGSNVESVDPHKLRRTKFTWMNYVFPAWYSYLQAIIGPVMPFLQDEFNMSYSLVGSHFSAFALGIILSGAVGGYLSSRMGRRAVCWIGSVGMALFAGVFIGVPHPYATLSATLLMGFFGTFCLQTSTAALSDCHSEHRSAVLSESLMFCCFAAFIAPLLVGASAAYVPWLGWRFSLAIAIVVWMTFPLAFSHVSWEDQSQPVADQPITPSSKSSILRLPLAFWLCCLILFLSVSHEWILIYWGAIHMETNMHLSKVSSATFINLFLLAMTIGRVFGSRILRSNNNTNLLLIASLVLNSLAFLPFWLCTSVPAVAITAFFFTGLGMSVQYPLTASLALGVVPKDLSNAASGTIASIGGVAIFIGCEGLGVLADKVNVMDAMVINLVLIAPATIVAIIIWRKYDPTRQPHKPEFIPLTTSEDDIKALHTIVERHSEGSESEM